jgi:hypothetical protein
MKPSMPHRQADGRIRPSARCSPGSWAASRRPCRCLRLAVGRGTSWSAVGEYTLAQRLLADAVPIPVGEVVGMAVRLTAEEDAP